MINTIIAIRRMIAFGIVNFLIEKERLITVFQVDIKKTILYLNARTNKTMKSNDNFNSKSFIPKYIILALIAKKYIEIFKKLDKT